MMLNVSELLSDSDFAQPLTIQRSTGAFALGVGWAQSSTPIQIVGVVTVAKERELKEVPEADRVIGGVFFYTTQALFISHGGAGAATSDVVIWRGDAYRLSKLWAYVDYGYFKAFGVRMSGQ